MKTLLLFPLLLFLLLSTAATAQRLGKWILPDGTTIERINDSTQLEEYNGHKWKVKIKWVAPNVYQVLGVTVRIDQVKADGSYKAMITDGRRKKYFVAKKI